MNGEYTLTLNDDGTLTLSLSNGYGQTDWTLTSTTTAGESTSFTMHNPARVR